MHKYLEVENQKHENNTVVKSTIYKIFKRYPRHGEEGHIKGMDNLTNEILKVEVYWQDNKEKAYGKFFLQKGVQVKLKYIYNRKGSQLPMSPENERQAVIVKFLPFDEFDKEWAGSGRYGHYKNELNAIIKMTDDGRTRTVNLEQIGPLHDHSLDASA